MDKVREFIRVAYEEYRRIVAHQIPIAFLGVELNGKAANVALRIRCAKFSGDGREAQKELRLGARLQHLRLRVLRDIAADREHAVSTPALGVYRPLWDTLTVLMCKFLDQLIVLQQQRTARTCTQGILVVRDRVAGARRELMIGWFERLVD